MYAWKLGNMLNVHELYLIFEPLVGNLLDISLVSLNLRQDR